MINQLSFWYTGQTVTSPAMSNFSQDIYSRFAQLTENQSTTSGVILSLASLSQAGGNVTIGAGSFRFKTSTLPDTPYSTAVFGNAPSAVVAVTGNGFIVARYVQSPLSVNETNYTFATSYLFVASVVAATDCLICTITAGVISGYGAFNYITNMVDNPITQSNIITSTAPPIGGNTPSTTVTTHQSPFNGYTEWNVYSRNGITNNYSFQGAWYGTVGPNGNPIVQQGVRIDTLGGGTTNSFAYVNSAYYPTGNLTVYNTVSGGSAGYTILAPSASNDYLGWYVSDTNIIDANRKSIAESFYNTAESAMQKNIWVSHDAAGANDSLTGISLISGVRPFIMGDAPAFSNSFAIFDDFANSGIGGGTAYFKVPNPTDPDNPIIVQMFNAGIPANTTQDVSYPIAFPNGLSSVMACLGSGLSAGETYTVGIDPGGDLTKASVTVITTDSGSQGCFFIAIGF